MERGGNGFLRVSIDFLAVVEKGKFSTLFVKKTGKSSAYFNQY